MPSIRANSITLRVALDSSPGDDHGASHGTGRTTPKKEPPMSSRSSFVLLALALTACSSTDEWKAPAVLVELYDMGDPAGLIEMELDRDGTLREIEVDVPLTALPRPVLDAAAKAFPGARFTGAEREVQAGVRGWEVKFELDGLGGEVVTDDAGNVRETERELREADVPAAVLAASATAIPGSVLVSTEVIESEGERSFHVKRKRDGASYKVVLTPAGEVVRKVREARAEIEIPLAR